MAGGQMLDIEAETAAAPLDDAAIRQLQAMKTGRAAALLGRGRRDRRRRERRRGAPPWCATAWRSARRSRSPTTFSMRKAPPSSSASAPARTPSATRARSSRSTGLTAPSRCATRFVDEALAALDEAGFAPKAIFCARRRGSSRRARTEGQAMSHERVQLGRPVRPRIAADRGRAARPEDRLRLREGPAATARARRLPRGEDRSRDLPRNGRTRLPRADDLAGIWRRGARLCRLRPHRARGGAGRFRLSLDDERAVVARHAADRAIRLARAEGEISAETRARRTGSAVSA